MQVTVILPTHNPDAARLHRTLAGLAAQTLPAAQWELIIVDNASVPPVDLAALRDIAPVGTRIAREPQPGLTHARRRGLAEAGGEFIVMVDDDNVLAPDYLAEVTALFAAQPQVGALGGRSVPEFAQPPAAWWLPEFNSLIACRDLGPIPLLSSDDRQYPACAPIGAGLALQRAAVQGWLADSTAGTLTDRRGGELTSGGDNDIILSVLKTGWSVGYFPTLTLIHLIPAARLEADYLARLNRGIAKSWMQVLSKHGVNPWPPIAPWTLPLRQMKAWFSYRAWSGPAAYIRWQGACGHFEGRAGGMP